MPITLLLLLGSHALADDSSASEARAEVVSVSPGWTCQASNEQLRLFERRARVVFLGQQRPYDIYVSPAGRPLQDPGTRVPDDVQLDAWRRWTSPVTVRVLLRPRPTQPVETTSSEAHGYSDISVAVSSGASHVDASAIHSTIMAGPTLPDCRRNSWTLHVTFEPPGLSPDARVRLLLMSLDDTDSWVRILAARELLLLGAHRERALAELHTAQKATDKNLRYFAAWALQRSPDP